MTIKRLQIQLYTRWHARYVQIRPKKWPLSSMHTNEGAKPAAAERILVGKIDLLILGADLSVADTVSPSAVTFDTDIRFA